jgi:drug/metabolite transporter (DMT)-like permease
MIKLNPWQMIAALAVLLGGIAVAHFFAPGSVALFVSLAAGFAGTVFLGRKDGGEPPAPPPNLTLLAGGGVLGLLACLIFLACAASNPVDRTELTHVASTLETCQEQGRLCKAFRDGGTNCFDVYDACVRDAGLR